MGIVTHSEPQKGQVVAVVRHRDDAYGEATADNAVKALQKIHFRVLDCQISEQLPEIDHCIAVLMCTERLDRAYPGTAAALEQYVMEGGGLVVLHRALHPDFLELFGITQQDRSAAPVASLDDTGLFFSSRVFPSFEGLKLDTSMTGSHASLDVVPQRHVRIAATTWTGKPLAWRGRQGAGQVLFWNTAFFNLRSLQGLIIESMSSVASTLVMPTVNAGVVQIDDFPAPLRVPDAKLVRPAVPEDFYSKTWWPDIHALASKHRIPLTCFAIFDYTNLSDEDANPIAATERALVETGTLEAVKRYPPAEIGLHGWNHMPLAKPYWSNRDEMGKSLDLALVSWKRLGLGALPSSYVPPMNIYDRSGVDVLAERLPGLRCISGLIASPIENGEPQDFGADPANSALIHLPRVTWGYESDAEVLFSSANEVAGMGLWTHFLHPDDISDVHGYDGNKENARNPSARSWRHRRGKAGLFDMLAGLLGTIKLRYPWLIYRTTTQAADLLGTFLDGAWSVEYGADSVAVTCPVGSFFRLRTNGSPRVRIADCFGARIAHKEKAEDYCLYLIETQEPEVVIRLEQEAPPKGLMDRFADVLRSKTAGRQSSGSRKASNPASRTRWANSG